MVCRILPKVHSRATWFLRSWLMYCFFLLLFGMALEFLLSDPGEVTYAHLFLLMPPLALICAWLATRAWSRIGWFTPESRECFLTLVEEGLLVETPAKGSSLYLPWRGLSYRHGSGMLQLMTHGALVCLISVNGLPKERIRAILAALREHSGLSQARHGMFTPEAVAAPFAPAPREGDLPPVPFGTGRLPAPRSVYTTVPALFSNTPRQWREALHLLQRPDWLGCSFYLLLIALLGMLSVVQVSEGNFLIAALTCAVGLLCIAKLLYPGRRRQRSVRGSIRMELSETEIIECWDDGAWARFRLPSAQEACLVRLPGSWCLRRAQALRAFLFDTAPALPPQLASYRREEAPSNIPRAMLGLLALFICAFLACTFYTYTMLAEDGSDVLADEFLALAAAPSAEALCEFAAFNFVSGKLYDTPRLEACSLPGEQEIAGYTLSFTESEPDDAAGMGHYAWSTRVYFSAEGELEDYESRPADWCPCPECLQELLEP